MSFRTVRLGLHGRIAVALSMTIALLLVIVAGSGFQLVQARSQQRQVIDDFYDALRTSQTYFINLLDVETAVRGYALTRNELTLAPMVKAGPPENADLVATVEAKLPEQSQTLGLLRAVDASGRFWYEQWAVPSVARLHAGGVLTTADVNRGQHLFDTFRANYDAYITQVRNRREQAAASLRALTNQLFGAVVMQALIAAIGGFVLWWLLRRWVSRPVERLGLEVRTVSDGNLDHAVVVHGPPEIVGLGSDVDRMRELLVEQIEQIAAAGEELQVAHGRLEQQANDLARSNRDLEQFAYVASHDLQEPLRKVASFCQLLERRYAGQLDERADQYIHFAVDGAKRMQQLINDLLEFSRVGRQAEQMSVVSLDDCLVQALNNLEVPVEQAGAKISSDPLPQVRGERGLLTQLLQNLLGNAIKFRSDQVPQVHVAARECGAFWEFSCSDNGIGIDPAYGERVFLIFQRLHAKDVYSGTGIGLALCKRIVEYHGGRIWVDDPDPSRPGATFRWTLPAVATGSIEGTR